MVQGRAGMVFPWLYVAAMLGTHPAWAAVATQRGALGPLDFQVPQGWSITPSAQNLVATSPDGQIMLLVAQHPMLTADNLDSTLAAGPVLPFFLPRRLGHEQRGDKPFRYRMADFEMKPLIGDAVRCTYAVLWTEAGGFMVLTKAPPAREQEARAAGHATVKSMRLSAAAKQALKEARQQAAMEQVRQEQAARQLGGKVVGRYVSKRSPSHDYVLHLTYWVCGNGTYLLVKSQMILTASAVSDSDQLVERGTWQVRPEGGQVSLLFTPVAGQPHAHALDVRQDTLGQPSIAAILDGNGNFQREGEGGCRQGQ